MENKPIWSPRKQFTQATQLQAFIEHVRDHFDSSVNDYHSLWQWSITHTEMFWQVLWEQENIIGHRGHITRAAHGSMYDVKWFPNATLNFAQNLLSYAENHPDQDALVFWGENEVQRTLSNADLVRCVSQCQQMLQAAGVVEGDRVVGYLPNLPEAVIAMLAASSIGAVWSSASPDFGIESVLDRFGQIEPKIMFCCDGYYYGGQWHSMHEKNQSVAGALNSLSKLIVVSYKANNEVVDYAATWQDELTTFNEAPIAYAQLPFDHPLYILFSSGTTGPPKCIVHGAGGTLLQHVKEHRLHADLRPGDRFFYFTTLGWMMWNWLVSGLASGATLLLYDGNPFARNSHGRSELIFDFADAERMTHLGTSAKFLQAANKADLKPRQSHQLHTLRALFSTGSPLAPEEFRYVYADVKPDLHLASISGGTDIVSCFVLGAPTLPVRTGEIQCRGLGMAVDVFDDQGRPMREGKGELVCTEAFPSMPLSFWDDDDRQRYLASYFGRFDNVWCHGDYVEMTQHNGIVIHGRSDAVLNPGGVRIGTAEIYRQVETIDEVLESVVIGQSWQGDVRVVLFVVLQQHAILDSTLTQRIRERIRRKATPRHVPAKVVQVADIPRTKSGKIAELAVRDAVNGRAIQNTNALANPEAIKLFENLAELTS